jgi:hypothetical protein
MSEATIVVEGTRLTDAQSMTFRCALNDFAMSLRAEGLGNDEHGKRITEGYLARIGEIMDLMRPALRRT